MSNSDKLRLKYGDPKTDKSFEKRHLALFTYPEDIQKAIPSLGKSIYCNKDIWEPLVKTYRDIIKKNLHKEIYSNDECFCIRDIRGFPGELSIHSWAMAIDLNVKDNPLSMTREQAVAAGLKPFTREFVQVWRDNGWVCGIDFKRGDGMHFERTKNL